MLNLNFTSKFRVTTNSLFRHVTWNELQSALEFDWLKPQSVGARAVLLWPTMDPSQINLSEMTDEQLTNLLYRILARLLPSRRNEPQNGPPTLQAAAPPEYSRAADPTIDPWEQSDTFRKGTRLDRRCSGAERTKQPSASVWNG